MVTQKEAGLGFKLGSLTSESVLYCNLNQANKNDI